MKALGVVIGDGHGSSEFIRQAAAWENYSRGRAVAGDVVEVRAFKAASLPIARRFDALHTSLSGVTDVKQLAVFCHGWSSGIQLCHGSRVEQLAKLLRAAMPGTNPDVTLYCCTTGSDLLASTSEVSGSEAPGGDGGFADRLRDELCEAGAVHCQVDAHTVLGHTTRNPYLRRFEGAGVPTGGVGGHWLVTPRSKLWPRWVEAMKGDLRWRFPTMTVGQIHGELAQAVAA